MPKIMKNFLFTAIIFLFAVIFSAHNALAANVSIDAPVSADTGENLKVTINADAGGVLINSIELVIEYNQDLLSFAGYSDDNAIVKLWINPPYAAEGKIHLSGIIPGGVLGLYDAKKNGLSPIPIVHLLFFTKNEGEAKFSFIFSKILKHDGLGTPLFLEELGSRLIIKNNPNNDIEKQKEENTADNNVTNLPDSPNLSNPAFLIILLIVISGIVGYKLLKYKYEKLPK